MKALYSRATKIFNKNLAPNCLSSALVFEGEAEAADWASGVNEVAVTGIKATDIVVLVSDANTLTYELYVSAVAANKVTVKMKNTSGTAPSADVDLTFIVFRLAE